MILPSVSIILGHFYQHLSHLVQGSGTYSSLMLGTTQGVYLKVSHPSCCLGDKREVISKSCPFFEELEMLMCSVSVPPFLLAFAILISLFLLYMLLYCIPSIEKHFEKTSSLTHVSLCILFFMSFSKCRLHWICL